ncbi:MAG TPA: type II secretion system protein, partial [Candidatus Acidoferrum sp.]|nr:type II secretion system protein [Candidatus Acidoferrum sp.]
MKALPITNRRTRAESAFTLLELLVVIAVVVTGAALLVPALAKTRTTSPAFQCMDNARQIALGWTMYASDNNGVLAPNSDGALAGKDPLHPSWVSGMLDFTTTADNTNTAMLVNHSLYPYGAYLGSYVGKNPAVFKCPGDRSAWAKDLTKPRVRSISMNCFVGNPTRSFTGSSKYPVNLKLMQVTAPALMFVTLDEHADSISDGWFATAPDEL